MNDTEWLQSEVARLCEDNERLRWRHPTVIPDWNDLPEGIRMKLVDLGRAYADSSVFGGDLAVNFYAEIRKTLAIEPAQ